jgi:hypothetical protein
LKLISITFYVKNYLVVIENEDDDLNMLAHSLLSSLLVCLYIRNCWD